MACNCFNWLCYALGTNYICKTTANNGPPPARPNLPIPPNALRSSSLLEAFFNSYEPSGMFTKHSKWAIVDRVENILEGRNKSPSYQGLAPWNTSCVLSQVNHSVLLVLHHIAKKFALHREWKLPQDISYEAKPPKLLVDSLTPLLLAVVRRLLPEDCETAERFGFNHDCSSHQWVTC